MHLNRACQQGSCVSINFLIFFDGELGVNQTCLARRTLAT